MIMMSYDIESSLNNQGFNNIVGVDESGLGSGAGCIYVGAVMFPFGIDYIELLPGINDSKKLKEKDRLALYPLIKKYALAWCVNSASLQEIEEHNVYWARFMAARRAIEGLKVKPDFVLMDGNKTIPEINIEQMAVVKGDSKSVSIAAASILAKVDRDNHILELSKKVHSDFDWANNKAYCTKKHIEALKRHGRTEWHRSKFVNSMLK